MRNDSQNYLSNKQLLWKQDKRYLVHFAFCESFKSTSNSLQNFKSLNVRVLEIMWGLALPPPLSIRCWGTVPNISVWEGYSATRLDNTAKTFFLFVYFLFQMQQKLSNLDS